MVGNIVKDDNKLLGIMEDDDRTPGNIEVDHQ